MQEVADKDYDKYPKQRKDISSMKQEQYAIKRNNQRRAVRNFKMWNKIYMLKIKWRTVYKKGQRTVE